MKLHEMVFFRSQVLFILVLFNATFALFPSRFHPTYVPIGAEFSNLVQYETKYFDSKVDHFNFRNDQVFKMKYLQNNSSWTAGSPIFFYTGNEGDIETFANNTGLMWETARRFKAMIIFAEHRFYGESMPFGKNSFKNSSFYGYLTSEQALADYAILIEYLKGSIKGAENSAVISFGGSYGGMLSAWLRIKYPNIVAGSIAASAPIWQFTGLTPCDAFANVTSSAFLRKGGKLCYENIRILWHTLRILAKTAQGRKMISSTLKLCNPLQAPLDAENLVAFFNDYLTTLAMVNYPYPANFLGKLPGWPVSKFCQPFNTTLNSAEQYLFQLHQAISATYNFSGDQKCLSADNAMKLNTFGWNYQVCNEMVFPLCSNNVDDIFPKIPWNMNQYLINCKNNFGMIADPYWIKNLYWGKKLQAASNIFFSNGDLDPWSSGGVLSKKWPNNNLPVYIIKNGAHHLDLRFSNELDPESVITVRQLEIQYITKWIYEWSKNM